VGYLDWGSCRKWIVQKMDRAENGSCRNGLFIKWIVQKWIVHKTDCAENLECL
jgi:hypothetical protein